MNRLLKRIIAFVIAIVVVLSNAAFGGVSLYAKGKKSVVSSQKKLNGALSDKDITSIAVESSKKAKLSAASEKYSKALTINGADLSFENSGKFKKITLKNAKVFTEKAKGNTVNITDTKATIKVNKKSEKSVFNVNAKKGTINFTINGKVEEININKKAKVNIKGKPLAAVTIQNNAKNSVIKVTASKAADITLNADAKITIGKKATGSKITLAKELLNGKVVNKSAKVVKIIDVEGAKRKVLPNVTATIKNGEVILPNEKIQTKNDIADTTVKDKTEPTDKKQTEQPKLFTVLFNTEGGSAISSRAVEQSHKLSKPADPTKEGYVFAGWYKDKALTQRYDFELEVVADFELYAKWDKQPEINSNPSIDNSQPQQPVVDPNQIKKVIKNATDGNVEAKVEIDLKNSQADSLKIEQVKDNDLINTNIPGYVGSAFDFSVDGTFDKAKISFAFKKELLANAGFVPAVYYFDEDKQVFEELNTALNDNEASVEVTHFSKYILLDKTEADLVWGNKIKKPVMADDGKLADGIDVMFAVNYSKDVTTQERLHKTKTLLDNFLYDLEDDSRAGLVGDGADPKTGCALTADREKVADSLKNLYPFEETSLKRVLSNAITELQDKGRKSKCKMIILACDLTDNSIDENYYLDLIRKAIFTNIKVYVIGIGEKADEKFLGSIAEGTDGKSYMGKDSSVLAKAFIDIKSETIDMITDKEPADGIPDYFNRILCEGYDNLDGTKSILRLGTGWLNPFYAKGISYEQLKADKDGDYDKDGIKNGDELIVSVNKSTGSVYVKMLSDPTSAISTLWGPQYLKPEKK